MPVGFAAYAVAFAGGVPGGVLVGFRVVVTVGIVGMVDGVLVGLSVGLIVVVGMVVVVVVIGLSVCLIDLIAASFWLSVDFSCWMTLLIKASSALSRSAIARAAASTKSERFRACASITSIALLDEFSA